MAQTGPGRSGLLDIPPECPPADRVNVFDYRAAHSWTLFVAMLLSVPGAILHSIQVFWAGAERFVLLSRFALRLSTSIMVLVLARGRRREC